MTRIASRAEDTAAAKVRGYGDPRARVPMPSELSPIPSHVSLRSGMHDLRNVLNAVQINAFAARELAGDGPRALACLERIEDAVQRGTSVLQAFPAEETLATAATVLCERLHDAGGTAAVSGDASADPQAPVPGLVREALCLVALESQARGARAFVLSIPGADGAGACLQCNAEGLLAPGPVTMALGSWGIPGLTLWTAPVPGGWTFRWTLRDVVPAPAVPA